MLRVTLALVASIGLTLASAPTASAQAINEGFDNVASLPAQGWTFVLNTSMPHLGGAWRQGNDLDTSSAFGPLSAAFTPQAGAPGSYMRSDYSQSNNGSVGVTESDWAILPTRTLSNGDTFSFFTRTNSGNTFPERLIVRMSANGASANVGTTDTSVGDFTTVLMDINPTQTQGPYNSVTNSGYPEIAAFRQFNFTLSGLPAGGVSGRLALHHFLTTGGPAGLSGNQMAIDTLSYTPVPEPAGLLVLALAAVAVRLRRAN